MSAPSLVRSPTWLRGQRQERHNKRDCVHPPHFGRPCLRCASAAEEIDVTSHAAGLMPGDKEWNGPLRMYNGYNWITGERLGCVLWMCLRV
jgi:hypothetical protein